MSRSLVLRRVFDFIRRNTPRKLPAWMRARRSLEQPVSNTLLLQERLRLSTSQ
jgi:hypothetical protein